MVTFKKLKTMKAIKRIVKVEDHKVSITLPKEFNAEEVEVIVFSKDDDLVLSDEQKSILDERLNEPEENYISKEKSLENLKKKYGL